MPLNETLQSLPASFEPGDEHPAILAFETDDVRRWSYGRLCGHVSRVTRELLASGVGAGDRVALLGPNRPEWIGACLAVLRAGAVATPLDVQFDDETLGQILGDCEARVILAAPDHVDRIDRLDLQHAPTVLSLEEFDDKSRRSGDDEERAERDPPRVSPDDIAVLFYTSGTTGAPKGVPLSHRNIAFEIETLITTRLATEADRVLLALPLHHVYPFVFAMLTPLALGIPIVVPSGLTGGQLTRAVREGQVTAIAGVPRLYRALYEGIEARFAGRGRWAGAMFSRLMDVSIDVRRRLDVRLGRLLFRPIHKQLGPRVRIVASGGSALAPELAWKLQGLGWDVATGYGLTETAPLLTLNVPGNADYESAGRPVSGVELRIDRNWRTARGEEDEEGPGNGTADESGGEVMARGPNVFRGYHNLPDKTREVLTEDGWFRTGDLGWFDDRGFLHLSGRTSTLIVTEGGTNVQPAYVERAYEKDAAIHEVGVLERDHQLVAVIVPERAEIRRRGVDPEGGVREAVERQSRQLASDQRISDFVLTDKSLPRTRLGKVRRHLLAERFEQALQEPQDAGDVSGPMAVEEMSPEDQSLLDSRPVRTVWQWLARRYPERRVTPDSNLRLDLGVDSLEWLNITMEIAERAGVELREEAIERIEKVRDLLQEVAEHQGRPGGGRAVSPLEQPEEFMGPDQRRWLEPLGPALSAVSAAGHGLDRLLMRTLYRVRAKGLERALPALDNGPVILTPNHVSYLDAFAIAAALEYSRLRWIYWAGWTGIVFQGPLTRAFSRCARVLPVDPNRGVRSSLAAAAAVLQRGESLVWFPEGERSPSGELQRFQPGIGMLLERFEVPVLPVYIRGTYEAWPRGQWFPRLARVTLVFGEPVYRQKLVAQASEGVVPEHIAGELRRRVAALASEV